MFSACKTTFEMNDQWLGHWINKSYVDSIKLSKNPNLIQNMPFVELIFDRPDSNLRQFIIGKESRSLSYVPLNENTTYYIWNSFPYLRKYMYKKFRGMSTKEVQKKWGRDKLITSEGISKYNKVEYSLNKWIENLQDYLKSAMSYTNSNTLEEFKETEYVFITENALKRFNK